MARVPNTDSTLLKLTTTSSTTTRIRPRLESRSNNGLARAAAAGSLALTASATPKGRSISRTSERAILAGLTDTPGSKIGNTSGM